MTHVGGPTGERATLKDAETGHGPAGVPPEVGRDGGRPAPGSSALPGRESLAHVARGDEVDVVEWEVSLLRRNVVLDLQSLPVAESGSHRGVRAGEPGAGRLEDGRPAVTRVVTHEDYLAAVTAVVCGQNPALAEALSEVRLVFGSGPRRRALDPLHRVWNGGEAVEPLPLVEIAAIGGLAPAETCHVVLHELAHVLAPGCGHGKEWRYAARQVGLLRPRARPDIGELADWSAISAAIRPALQALPEPTERAPAEYFSDWHRRGCSAGYGTRGGRSRGEGAGSRYLKVMCGHPGCGYQVRVTRKWLEMGAPRCPVAGHGSMELEQAANRHSMLPERGDTGTLAERDDGLEDARGTDHAPEAGPAA